LEVVGALEVPCFVSRFFSHSVMLRSQPLHEPVQVLDIFWSEEEAWFSQQSDLPLPSVLCGRLHG